MAERLVHLVDDDANVRAMLARLLQSGGYAVREYQSGKELLAATRSLTDGCILLDVHMPGQDGFNIQRSLRDQSIRLPVILMTGSGDLKLLALKAGAADFMQKPFDRSELLTVLDRLSAAAAHG